MLTEIKARRYDNDTKEFNIMTDIGLTGKYRCIVVTAPNVFVAKERVQNKFKHTGLVDTLTMKEFRRKRAE